MRSRMIRGLLAACLVVSALICVTTSAVAQQVGDAFIVFDVGTGELRMNPGNAGKGGAGSVGNGISSYGIRPNPATITLSNVATNFSYLSGSYPLFPPTLGNVTVGDDNTVGAAFYTLGSPNVNASIGYFNNQNMVVSSAVAGTSGATSWGPGTGGVVLSTAAGTGYVGSKEWSFGTIGSTGMTVEAALAAFGATTQGGLSSSAQVVYGINGVVGTQNFRVFAVPEPSTIAMAGCGLAALGGFAWRKRRGAKSAIAA